MTIVSRVRLTIMIEYRVTANAVINGLASVLCNFHDTSLPRRTATAAADDIVLPPASSQQLVIDETDALVARYRIPKFAKRLPVCNTPMSRYSAFAAEPRPMPGSTCRRFEDKPGKPGYICKGEEFMEFELKFGKIPRLVISYLQSYEAIGDAVLSMNGREAILGGYHDGKTSQTHVAFIYASHQDMQNDMAGRGNIGLQGFDIQPETVHTLRIHSSHQNKKIKIISVITC